MLEMIAPHLALIIDRTEWAKKQRHSSRCPLLILWTGLPNRRYLQDRLFEEVERSKRYDTPLSFMIIDVDRFKTYNDIYGHTNADRVLVQTAQLLRRLDSSDRYVGEVRRR
jgi:diguanylate cyclase (GGDEF)-like protein